MYDDNSVLIAEMGVGLPYALEIMSCVKLSTPIFALKSFFRLVRFWNIDKDSPMSR